jgi:rare lipoprotein A
MRARKGMTAIISCSLLILGLLAGCTPGTSQVRNNRGYNSGNKAADRSYESNSFGEESSDFGNNESGDDTDFDNSRQSRGNAGQRNRESRGDENVFNVRSSGADERPPEGDTRSSDLGINSSRRDDRFSGPEDRSYKQKEYYQTGIASWYGREFHGRVTASGEKFNMKGLTAAHKKLPFGTLLEVTNFDNGRKVRVRVNDRGPYRGKRIMDLSYGAAKKLGMVSPGKAMVGIRILSRDQDYTRDSGEESYSSRKNSFVEPVVRNESTGRDDYSRSGGNYSVQAGAFYSRRNAERLKTRIEAITRNSVVIINDGDLYKVRVKGIENRSEAGRFKRMLADENINSFIMERE